MRVLVIGSVNVGPNFTATGLSPTKMLIPFDRYLIALQPYRWKFLDKMKLCGILVMFLSKFLRKETTNLVIWSSEHRFEEVTSDAQPWLIARWKADVSFSIRVKWTIFAIFTVPELWGEMYTARLFFRRGSTPLHSNFAWTGSSPSTILGIRKQEN